MVVIPKLDITAAAKYVERSDFFLATFRANRSAVEIRTSSASPPLCFSGAFRVANPVSPLNLSLSSTKQTVKLGFFLTKLRTEGKSSKVGVGSEIGLGERNGEFLRWKAAVEVAAKETIAAMDGGYCSSGEFGRLFEVFIYVFGRVLTQLQMDVDHMWVSWSPPPSVFIHTARTVCAGTVFFFFF